MPAVYTRTGDKGDTGLFGGSRVAKQSLRVEAYGTVDEANAALGEARAAFEPSRWRNHLHAIQLRLFVVAAELASDAQGAAQLGNTVSAADIAGLERLIDECLEITGPQRAFVVPGRDPLSARLHLARTIVRRAERRTLTLAEREPVRPELVTYLNRLSDAVYALARLAETWHDRARVERAVRDAVAKLLPGEAAPASDPAPATTGLTLDLAQRLASAAEQAAQARGVPMVIAVVDSAGNLVLLHRMPGSLLASLELAPNKAWTANAFKQSSAAVGELAAQGGPLPGLASCNSGRVVLFGGGAPLVAQGAIVGALGVSGGTVEEDIAVMNEAINKVMGVQK
ncbi:MAG TPA: cob(I)yrinic acid a,c-diamide adenosyltransferase [Propionicimonas sp.]|jgi:ATP:cob(I)alamin adenosyltransferase